ncbi:MAG: hypothetical protein R3B48_20965 [Kofleriaceae bacterium]
MNDLPLTGLDGQNPLAFLAALGLLRVLDESIPAERPRPRLYFDEGGATTAHLVSELTVGELYELILKDAAGPRGEAALSLAYNKEGTRADARSEGAIADLKPPPSVARAFLLELAARGVDRRDADLGAAFFSELITDHNGNTKPTALHFTAGQQKFLEMVSELRRNLQQAHLEEALFGPWRGEDPLPSLSWDSTVARQYALRAVNPSSEKRGSVAGANWLAVIGLSYFEVNARGDRLVTAGVEGGWKSSVFRWPVWTPPCTRREISGLLRGAAHQLRAPQRAALGISQVFECAITRSDQGGYGGFSPAAPV